MLTALALSIAQLRDPPVLRVLFKSLAITLLLFVAIGVGAWAGVRALVAAGFGAGWGEVAGLAAILLAVASAWLLFRAVAVAVVGIFADEIVAAVEARHYPSAVATARPVSFARGAAMGLASAGRVIGINLLLSPIYLLLIFTGIGTAIAFFLVNGWLLGRDLGDMVAARHRPREAMRDWRATTGAGRYLLGLAGAGLLLLPLANLLAPVIAAAMATHWYHRRKSA